MNKAPAVDVIIPNWNGRKYLETVLPSLDQQTFQDFRTTVVDNGSSDDSLSYLKTSWPQVNVVPLSKNVGFAPAITKALVATGAPLVVLLNNDMELDPDWLKHLTAATKDKKVGFVASKMRQFTDRTMLDEAGHDVSLYGVSVPRGFQQPDSAEFDKPAPTTAASGGASLYRREMLERIGGFDTDYFFYYEDVDVCLRGLWAGYTGRYEPKAVVYHMGGASSGRLSDFSRYHLTRNLLLTVGKDFSAGMWLRHGWKIAFHQLRMLSAARKDGWLRPYLKGVGAALLALPKTVLKHRRVMGNRRISTAEFEQHFRSDYPFPTKFKAK